MNTRCHLLSFVVTRCPLIKRFTNSHKRYSSRLQLSILHRVAPIKAYLKFMTVLKTAT